MWISMQQYFRFMTKYFTSFLLAKRNKNILFNLFQMRRLIFFFRKKREVYDFEKKND